MVGCPRMVTIPIVAAGAGTRKRLGRVVTGRRQRSGAGAGRYHSVAGSASTILPICCIRRSEHTIHDHDTVLPALAVHVPGCRGANDSDLWGIAEERRRVRAQVRHDDRPKVLISDAEDRRVPARDRVADEGDEQRQTLRPHNDARIRRRWSALRERAVRAGTDAEHGEENPSKAWPYVAQPRVSHSALLVGIHEQLAVSMRYFRMTVRSDGCAPSPTI